MKKHFEKKAIYSNTTNNAFSFLIHLTYNYIYIFSLDMIS